MSMGVKPNSTIKRTRLRTKLGRSLEAAAREVAAYLRGETVPGMRIYHLESTQKIHQQGIQSDINQGIDKDKSSKN